MTSLKILPNILTLIVFLIFIKAITHYLHIAFFDWIIYAITPFIIFISYLFVNTKIKYNSISLILLFMLIYLTINTFIKTTNIILTVQSITILLSYLLLYTLFINIKKNERKQYGILLFLIIILILLPFEHFKTTDRINGLLGNPNLTAHFILMILPMTLYFQRKRKKLQLLSLLIVLIVLIETESRSGLLIYGLVLIFFFLYKNNFIRTTLSTNIIVVLLSFVLTLVIIDLAKFVIHTDLVSQFLGSSRLAYTGDNHRYAIWTEAISLWNENIITGVGMGIKFHNSTHIDTVLGFHNTFLNILTTGGLIGLFLFLLLLFLFIKYNSNYKSISKYKMLQLIIFVSLSYSATTFFVINFHFYLLFMFQTMQEKNNI